MTTALQTAGYTMGEPGNNTAGTTHDSVVYYAAGDAAAQAVAKSVADELGGVQIEPMPTPPPIDTGLGTSTVLVMVGIDTAGKTLADLSAAADAPPPPAGDDRRRCTSACTTAPVAGHGSIRRGTGRRRRRARCTSAARRAPGRSP